MYAIRSYYVTINTINEEVGKIMESQLLKLGLISVKDIENQNPEWPAYKKYYMHGTCHFLGMDVHDVGTNDTPWEPGMILTNEPGIYIEEKGFGIRLENDILITKDGNIDLIRITSYNVCYTKLLRSLKHNRMMTGGSFM